MLRKRALLPIMISAVVFPAWAQDATQLEGVTVIGVSPTDTTGVPLDRYPANAQKLTAEDLEKTQAQSLSELLGRRGNSVFLSDAQNNPYQPDLFYRGYSISPLLGLPQGLALYIDGVRANEVFGDVVNWDLIPDAAVDSLELIPGSNPVFGQNTLAGAISLKTKSGFDAPGSKVELVGGSYGRYGVDLEHGYSNGPLAFFVSGEYDHEDGWRTASPSRIGRLFAKGSYQDKTDSADLSISLADNNLIGNGAAPELLLRNEGRRAVFTTPDQTKPDFGIINLQGNHIFSRQAQLSGNVYYRRERSRSFNGDGPDYDDCADPANQDAQGNPFLCSEPDDDGGVERVVIDKNGQPVVSNENNNSGTFHLSTTDQFSTGFRTQLTLSAADQPRNRIIVGGSVDIGRSRFNSETELAALTDGRAAIGSGQFDTDEAVGVRTHKDLYSAFVIANWEPIENLDVTAAGAVDHTAIKLADQNPDGDLDGKHGFTRVNPSIGATYHVNKPLAVFAQYSESSRAPTPVELTCANPDDPCLLPNGFVDDPPLKQVVTRTIEAGVRYTGPSLQASAAFFNSANSNDILFITDGQLTTQGYFSNVGDTLRRGFEIGGNYKITRHLSAGLQYTYLDALFKQDFLVNSPNHPVRDPNDPDSSSPAAEQVHSGNRIPLIPRHLAKANIEWRNDYVGAGVEAQGRSNSRFRGDEANIDTNTVPGYAIFNLYGDWKPLHWMTVFARVTNLFNRDIDTFGVYGDAGEVLGDGYQNARRFVGPGAPREFSAGIRAQF